MWCLVRIGEGSRRTEHLSGGVIVSKKRQCRRGLVRLGTVFSSPMAAAGTGICGAHMMDPRWREAFHDWLPSHCPEKQGDQWREVGDARSCTKECRCPVCLWSQGQVAQQVMVHTNQVPIQETRTQHDMLRRPALSHTETRGCVTCLRTPQILEAQRNAARW